MKDKNRVSEKLQKQQMTNLKTRFLSVLALYAH